MTDLLKNAYDPEQFRNWGHELIDLIADQLKQAQSDQIPANRWIDPQSQFAYWQDYDLADRPPIDLFRDILDRSIMVQHPRYMGHQIAPPVPIAALANLLSGILNNGMAVYEMGAPATAIERLVCQQVSQQLGFDEQSDGFLTSGGTLANLTALLAARSDKAPSDVWENGTSEKLAVMVCEEAHYCVDRAIKIMGLGAPGLIKVPSRKNFKMNTDLLETYLAEAKKENIHVIAVVGSAPSTSTGTFDPLDEIADFCEKHNLWFHVDGAHGGAAIYSEKYKPLLKGIERADSVVIDGHKMMMTPSIMTFLLFKNKLNSYQTFSQKAQYLWANSENEEWYNLAKRTFECTKEMMSIKFYAIQQVHGNQIFDDFVSTLFDLGQEMAAAIRNRPKLELGHNPDCNIVCFRCVSPDLKSDELNRINAKIRNLLLEDGTFYIVQTTLNDKLYLRVTMMHPMTTSNMIHELLDQVEGYFEKELKNIQIA